MAGNCLKWLEKGGIGRKRVAIAGNGVKLLEIAGMVGNGINSTKQLKMFENNWKCIEISGSCEKWLDKPVKWLKTHTNLLNSLEMAKNVWKLPEMAGIGLKWLKLLEMANMARSDRIWMEKDGNDLKWLKMAENG